MGRLRFLKGREPLAAQVAKELAGAHIVRPLDLSRTLVLVPTAGAARRIRRELAGYAVLSPKFSQPMQALLNDARSLASRFEREAAWARVLESAGGRGLEPLFDEAHIPSSAHERTKAGGVLCDLCDLLAEAALTPATVVSPETPDGYNDTSRWTVLASLYGEYIELLQAQGLADANESRIAESANPDAEIERLVVACVPDLPPIVQRFATALENRGVAVDVLVWQPGESAAGFDAWGRPLPKDWADCQLPIEDPQIHPANEATDEAGEAIDYAASAGKPGDCAIILAEASHAGVFQAEVLARGGRAFLPEGRTLAVCEAGTLALLWSELARTRDLRTLRRLCELPAFARLVSRHSRSEGGLSVAQLLAACDYLIGTGLATTLDEGFQLADTGVPTRLDGNPEDPGAQYLRNVSKPLLAIVQELLREHPTASNPAGIVQAAWEDGGEGIDDARRVVELAASVTGSPLLAGQPELVEVVFARALRTESAYEASAPGDVELSGWLEAPWVDAPRLALCGVVEGALPSAVHGHPFLPDPVRTALGLADNASRLARDAYLLDCLCHSRSKDDFHCFLAKFGAQGDPHRPSSLLMRCAEDDLPRRVLHLVGTGTSRRSRAARTHTLKWSLREPDRRNRPEKISPTGFESYLSCPFRFYLRNVLRLDSFTADAREMDSLAFGNIIHEVLERFGRNVIAMGDSMLRLSERDITDALLPVLEAAARWRFGLAPSPAVRIQIENIKARLIAFARIQAAEFAAGWVIRDVERKLSADGPNPLMIGPLALSGKIDRIDFHPATGAWRVMDYKTFGTKHTPSAKHLGSANRAWLNEALVEVRGKKSPLSKAWANLQLPLYRMIASHWHGIGKADPIATGYFVLPSDPNDSGIELFHELDESVNPGAYESALTCARAVAERVARGCFWPPQPWRGSWDDPAGAILAYGKPEDCVEEETIDWLKGDAQ